MYVSHNVYESINTQISIRINVSISAHIIVLPHYFFDCIISHILVSISKYNYKYN